MKTIGLIGGMSWESTVSYYRHINEGVKARLGGLHSAKIILYSVDFAEIEHLQRCGEWDAAGEVLAAAAQALQGAGADFIVLCTNTMHKVAAAIEAAVDIPLLHIVDPTARAIRAAGFTRVGLSWAHASPWISPSSANACKPFTASKCWCPIRTMARAWIG